MSRPPLDTVTRAVLSDHISRAGTAVDHAFRLGFEVGERTRPEPRCEFYDDSPEHPGIVVQDVEHTVPPVEGSAFFIPVRGGGAVRVHVCEKHLDELCRRYASEDSDGDPERQSP